MIYMVMMLECMADLGLEGVVEALDDPADRRALRASCRAGRRLVNAAVDVIEVSFDGFCVVYELPALLWMALRCMAAAAHLRM